MSGELDNLHYIRSDT